MKQYRQGQLEGGSSESQSETARAAEENSFTESQSVNPKNFTDSKNSAREVNAHDITPSYSSSVRQSSPTEKSDSIKQELSSESDDES